jgi:signal transduction histidine kinase
LSSHAVSAVLAATDGSLWFGTDKGLNRWKNEQVTIYRKRSLRSVRGDSSVSALAAGWAADSRGVREITDDGLPADAVESVFEDYRGQIWVTTQSGVAILKSDGFRPVSFVPYGLVFAITGDRAGNVWMSHQEGLFHFARESVVEHTPWAALGRREPATALLHDAVQGGLWLGFRDGGVAHSRDGQLTASYAGGEGLGEGLVGGFHIDGDGTLWAATEGGLSRIKDGRALTLTSRNGLPCDTVHWIKEDDARSVWLYMACGLVRVARSELDAWAAHPESTLRPTVFDSGDGVRSHRFRFGYSAIVTKSADGKLWFVPSGGVSVIDPRHLPGNKLPPPTYIEQVIADGETYDAHRGLRLPPRVRDLAIDFTALSYVAPEKNRFRVMLERRDRDWQDLGTRRQAFYTDLAPGSYRFRVKGSNNGGVWDEDGASLEFSVAPAYYQTSWFRAASAAIFALLLWAGYRVRVGVIERHEADITALNERLMKAQEQERMRIAGELHDGVMQQISALTLMLGTARRQIPEDLPAKAAVGDVQKKLIQVGTDVRQLSHDLHPASLKEQGLPDALRAYCDEFSRVHGISVSSEADETVRDLSRGAALALFRITQEALGNAAAHGAATHVDVRLTRSNGQVALSVSDNGKGFDPNRITSGGLGLVNMRERARQLHGTFAVDSERGRGTTVSVTIPFRPAV